MSECDQILAKWRNEDWTDTEEFERASYVSPSRIFTIGGCARSGTSLLRVMLDTHTSVACGPASSLFVPVPIDIQLLAFRFGLPQYTISHLASEAQDRAEFIERFKDAYLSATGRSVWGDKTARNVHCFEWIAAHFPRAALIHVVRDGRDVVCSLRTHRKRRVVDGHLEPTGYRLPLDAAATRWVNAISDGIRLRTHPNYLEVRYEELISQPESTLRAVCSRLGVRFEARMLEYYKVTGGSRDPLKMPQNVEATLPLYTHAVRRWQTDLTSNEYDAVMEIIGPTLRLLGYV